MSHLGGGTFDLRRGPNMPKVLRFCNMGWDIPIRPNLTKSQCPTSEVGHSDSAHLAGLQCPTPLWFPKCLGLTAWCFLLRVKVFSNRL